MKMAINRRQFTAGGIAAGALAAPGLAPAQPAPVKIRLGFCPVISGFSAKGPIKCDQAMLSTAANPKAGVERRKRVGSGT